MTLGQRTVSSDVSVFVTDLSNLTGAMRGTPVGGVLGAGFLYRHAITIDPHRERVYFHRSSSN